MIDVLIVEDSPTAAFVITHMLEDLGYKVKLAEDGKQAVLLARKFRPKVILMDLVMPNLDGFQATRLIKRDPQLKDIPIIIHSTKSDDTDKYWAKLQGANGFVEKPPTKSQIQQVLSKFITTEGTV